MSARDLRVDLNRLFEFLHGGGVPLLAVEQKSEAEVGVRARQVFETFVCERQSKLLGGGVRLPGGEQRLGELNPGFRKRRPLLQAFVENLDRLGVLSLTVISYSQIQARGIVTRIETDCLREGRNRFVQAVELHIERAQVVERAQVLRVKA